MTLIGHLPDSQRVAHGLNLHARGLYFGPRLLNEATCVGCGSVVKRRKLVTVGIVLGVASLRLVIHFKGQARASYSHLHRGNAQGIWR